MCSENIEILHADEGRRLATSEIVFQRILVATDSSKPSEQALKTETAISQLFGSQFFLVHAAMSFYYSTGTAHALPSRL